MRGGIQVAGKAQKDDIEQRRECGPRVATGQLNGIVGQAPAGIVWRAEHMHSPAGQQRLHSLGGAHRVDVVDVLQRGA
ncbi:hypothetical protein BMMON2_50070 [Burkholderia mallei]